MCEEVAVETGITLARSAVALGLSISAKSKVVFNRPGVAREVARRLKEAGVEVTAAELTKDLGIGTTACASRRIVKCSTERLGKMAKRLRRVKTLVRVDRRCRALAWTGCKPQGTRGR